MTGNIPPSFTDSGREEALLRLSHDNLRDGDIAVLKEIGDELLKAEMWNSISKEEICQEYFEVIKEELLAVIAHAVGQHKEASVTSESIDGLASEVMEEIMSAFVEEVDNKTLALGDEYFIDDGEELTFDFVVAQVSKTITQLHEERHKFKTAIDEEQSRVKAAVSMVINGLDAPIQDIVRSSFKKEGLII